MLGNCGIWVAGSMGRGSGSAQVPGNAAGCRGGPADFWALTQVQRCVPQPIALVGVSPVVQEQLYWKQERPRDTIRCCPQPHVAGGLLRVRTLKAKTGRVVSFPHSLTTHRLGQDPGQELRVPGCSWPACVVCN